MCRFREIRRWLSLSHGMVHWVSGGMFLKHCILLSTIFIVSKGRSVGLRPRVPLKQPGFKRAQVAFLGVYPQGRTMSEFGSKLTCLFSSVGSMTNNHRRELTVFHSASAHRLIRVAGCRISHAQIPSRGSGPSKWKDVTAAVDQGTVEMGSLMDNMAQDL